MKRKVLLISSIVIAIILLVFSNQSFAETNNLVPSPESNTKRYIRRYSSLVPISSGYMRVFYNTESKKIDVEYYDNNFKITDKKHIDMELEIWGGFFAGSDAYYAVEGQNNKEEDTDKEVIRVIKYNTNWEKIGHSSITGNTNTLDRFYKDYAEVRFPFNSGSVEMTEVGGKLYIVTGHQGYVDEAVGQGHQGLLMIEVDENTFEGNIVDADLYHSFTQYIDNKDNNLYLVELSEGSYCTLLTKYDRNNNLSRTTSRILEYGGERTSAWAVSTYSSVDGIAVSNNNILSIGTSIDQSKYDSVTSSTAHNIYLGITPINDVSKTSSKYVWLTNYSDENNKGKSFTGLEITKINDNKFIVLWQEYEESTEMVDNDTLSTGVVHYIFIDENGNKLSEEHKVNATMSDCEPIVKNSKVVFYSSNGSMVDFYTIDANTGAFDKVMYRVAGENASWTLNEKGVLTISGKGDILANPDAGDIIKLPLSSTRGSYSYGSSDNGWKPVRSLIKKIVINEGLTSVADKKFQSFMNLTQVILPASMKTIGKEAFSWCANLDSIYILSGVESIGEDALWSGYYSYNSDKKLCYATVYTFQGSYAEQWAKDNNISYKYIEHIPYDDQIGWVKDGKTWYYYDENGNKKVDGKFKINEKYYWFDKDGKMITAGWYQNPKNTYSEEWYYINPDGDCAIGWIKDGKIWYYLGKEGEMCSNDSYKINGKVYLFDKNGAMVEGTGWERVWISTRSVWYYLDFGGSDTVCHTGWKQLGKYWYYFDTNTGVMADDSQLADGKVELFDSEGAWIDSSKMNGWFQYRGYWYYKNSKSGKLSNGWEFIGNVWYYLDKNTGKMHSGTYYPETIDGKLYMFDKSGAMKTGWIKVNRNSWNSNTGKYELKEFWYYSNSDGALYAGKWYKQYKGYDYYFNYGGEMVANQSEYYVYNEEAKKGEYYSFDEEGRCTGKVR